MALTDKKYEKFYDTTGSGDDKVTAENLTKAEAVWDHYRAKGMDDYFNDLDLAPIIFQLQQMQDEIDYLRTEISSNKDKATFPGLGTSSTTALAGDTALLTLGKSGTTAMAGNTALLALGTSGTTALAGDTNIVTIGSSTTISFGDMITVTNPKSGKITGYNIVMMVTKGGVSKSTTLTLT